MHSFGALSEALGWQVTRPASLSVDVNTLSVVTHVSTGSQQGDGGAGLSNRFRQQASVTY